MTAPSIRQDAYTSLSGNSITVNLSLTPNVGNRLLAVVWHDDRTALIKGGSPDPITPTTGSGWVLADYLRTWSFYGSVEIYYRDVQSGDSTSYTFTSVDTHGWTVQLFEMLDFTEAPVLRDADVLQTVTDRLSTKSTGTNSMSLLIGKSTSSVIWVTPTGYTNGGPPASASENPYLFYATNQNLVAVSATTTENRLALQVEIPETGATAPASWDRHLQYEINSVTGDFNTVGSLPNDLADQVWDNKITFNITEAANQGTFDGGNHAVYSSPDYYTSFIVDPSVRHDGVDAYTGAHVRGAGTTADWDIRIRYAASYLYLEGLAFIRDDNANSSFNGVLYFLGASPSTTVGSKWYGENVVVDKCLFSYDPANTTGFCNTVDIQQGAENASDKWIMFSNCVFHSNRYRNAIYVHDTATVEMLWTIYIDNCSFGFNGSTSVQEGSAIWFDQDNNLSDTTLYLYNSNFGDNFDDSGGTEYTDIRYNRGAYPSVDGTSVLNGANNVFQNPPPASFTNFTNNLTGSITAANGFTQTTTQQFGIIVASTSTFGAYDLDLVQPTGSGINLALKAGTSRIGFEPDPVGRQDFTYDVLGRLRFSQAYDTGAFQISSGVAFKYWNGTAFVNSDRVRYWDGSAWQEVSEIKYWDGTQWAFPNS